MCFHWPPAAFATASGFRAPQLPSPPSLPALRGGNADADHCRVPRCPRTRTRNRPWPRCVGASGALPRGRCRLYPDNAIPARAGLPTCSSFASEGCKSRPSPSATAARLPAITPAMCCGPESEFSAPKLARAVAAMSEQRLIAGTRRAGGAPMSRRRRYRTGRGKGEEQYFGLSYAMARSPAFRSLSGPALKVFIEVRTRFHGGNNGDLSLSMDEAARLLGIGKGTAQRAFAELEDKGFLADDAAGAMDRATGNDLAYHGQGLQGRAANERLEVLAASAAPAGCATGDRAYARAGEDRRHSDSKGRPHEYLCLPLVSEALQTSLRWRERSEVLLTACRRFFDGAARAWVRQAIDDGTLTLPDLQKASPATRAFVTALKSPLGLGEEPSMLIASPRPPQAPRSRMRSICCMRWTTEAVRRATIPVAFGAEMERKTFSRCCSGTVRVLHRCCSGTRNRPSFHLSTRQAPFATIHRCCSGTPI